MEEKVFVHLVGEMTDAMYRVSISILHAQADAQDAVQQALLKAWQIRQRLRAEYFKPYLMRMVINECRNLQRARTRLVTTERMELFAGTQPPEDISLRDALDRLPQHLRIALVLKYVEGYSEKDMAWILKLPVTTVKSRLRHGREKLRHAWKEDGVCERI